MANEVYDNIVLETRFNELLETKLNTRALMTVDTDLSENEGMKKRIKRYGYSGTVEELAMGEGNTVEGEVSMDYVDYEVKTYQQKWKYYDEEVATDKNTVERGLSGMASTMVNHFNQKFFDEITKTTLVQGYDSFGYDMVVDAIAKMNLEDENGLVLVMGNDLKAVIRKDDDFIASKAGEILYTGQFGSICGVACLFSKKIPEGVCYLATKEAVTLFVKKENEMEFDRDKDKRENMVWARRVGVTALTDSTKAVAIRPYIVAPVITTTAIDAGSNKALAGTCVAGATITIYKNGSPLTVSSTVQTGTVTGNNWTYTIATATADEVYSVVASKTNFASKASADSLTVGA